MKVSVTEAKAQLTELVKRAEAGDEVILTRRGQDVARLVPIGAARDATASCPDGAGPDLRVRQVQSGSRRGTQPGLSLWRRRSAGMIAVDTSALMSILLGEPEADNCMVAIEEADKLLISAGTMAEALSSPGAAISAKRWPS